MTSQLLPEELYLYTLHLPEDVEPIFLHDQPFLAETLTEFGLHAAFFLRLGNGTPAARLQARTRTAIEQALERFAIAVEKPCVFQEEHLLKKIPSVRNQKVLWQYSNEMDVSDLVRPLPAEVMRRPKHPPRQVPRIPSPQPSSPHRAPSRHDSTDTNDQYHYEFPLPDDPYCHDVLGGKSSRLRQMSEQAGLAYTAYVSPSGHLRIFGHQSSIRKFVEECNALRKSNKSENPFVVSLDLWHDFDSARSGKVEVDGKSSQRITRDVLLANEAVAQLARKGAHRSERKWLTARHGLEYLTVIWDVPKPHLKVKGSALVVNAVMPEVQSLSKRLHAEAGVIEPCDGKTPSTRKIVISQILPHILRKSTSKISKPRDTAVKNTPAVPHNASNSRNSPIKDSPSFHPDQPTYFPLYLPDDRYYSLLCENEGRLIKSLAEIPGVRTLEPRQEQKTAFRTIKHTALFIQGTHKCPEAVIAKLNEECSERFLEHPKLFYDDHLLKISSDKQSDAGSQISSRSQAIVSAVHAASSDIVAGTNNPLPVPDLSSSNNEVLCIHEPAGPASDRTSEHHPLATVKPTSSIQGVQPRLPDEAATYYRLFLPNDEYLRFLTGDDSRLLHNLEQEMPGVQCLEPRILTNRGTTELRIRATASSTPQVIERLNSICDNRFFNHQQFCFNPLWLRLGYTRSEVAGSESGYLGQSTSSKSLAAPVAEANLHKGAGECPHDRPSSALSTSNGLQLTGQGENTHDDGTLVSFGETDIEMTTGNVEDSQAGSPTSASDIQPAESGILPAAQCSSSHHLDDGSLPAQPEEQTSENVSVYPVMQEGRESQTSLTLQDDTQPLHHDILNAPAECATPSDCLATTKTESLGNAEKPSLFTPEHSQADESDYQGEAAPSPAVDEIDTESLAGQEVNELRTVSMGHSVTDITTPVQVIDLTTSPQIRPSSAVALESPKLQNMGTDDAVKRANDSSRGQSEMQAEKQNTLLCCSIEIPFGSRGVLIGSEGATLREITSTTGAIVQLGRERTDYTVAIKAKTSSMIGQALTLVYDLIRIRSPKWDLPCDVQERYLGQRPVAVENSSSSTFEQQRSITFRVPWVFSHQLSDYDVHRMAFSLDCTLLIDRFLDTLSISGSKGSIRGALLQLQERFERTWANFDLPSAILAEWFPEGLSSTSRTPSFRSHLCWIGLTAEGLVVAKAEEELLLIDTRAKIRWGETDACVTGTGADIRKILRALQELLSRCDLKDAVFSKSSLDFKEEFCVESGVLEDDHFSASRTRCSFQLHSRAKQVVFGVSGSIRDNIATSTGCKITFDHRQHLILEGDTEHVREALSQITDLLRTKWKHWSPPSRVSRQLHLKILSTASANDLRDDTAEHMCLFPISTIEIPVVIGCRGRQRQDICDFTGAEVEFDPGVCCLFGRWKSIRHALSFIWDKLSPKFHDFDYPADVKDAFHLRKLNRGPVKRGAEAQDSSMTKKRRISESPEEREHSPERRRKDRRESSSGRKQERRERSPARRSDKRERSSERRRR